MKNKINNLKDWKLVNFAEIDKYAIKAYESIHEVDDSLNLGDVSNVDMDSVENFDCLFGGSPCLTGDSLIITKRGLTPLNQVKIGDFVLDLNGDYKKVLKIYDQGRKQTYRINAMLFDGLLATKNHKFYVRKKFYKWNNIKRQDERKFSNPEWIELEKLNKDYYMGFPINKNSIIPEYKGVLYNNKILKKDLDISSEWLWYLVGRYLGDGWITYKYRKEWREFQGIRICCGKYRYEKFEKKLKNVPLLYCKTDEGSIYKYQFSNKELGVFMNQFGSGAKNKYIPGFVFDMPIKLIKSLIDGYMESDGCIVGNTYKATTISKKLAYGMSQLIMKVYHVPVKIYKNTMPKKTIIEGRTVNQNDFYQIVFKLGRSKFDKAFYENGYVWYPIKSINKNEILNVYDIEVEDTHSFVANNCIVHNCQDFSLAGKLKGSKWKCEDCGYEYNPIYVHYSQRNKCPKCQSENLSGTRSSLLVEYLRFVREKQPKFGIYENVKNIVGKKFKETFDLFISELEEYGYNVYWKVLNGKNYLIPQNRERVFVVYVRKDLDNGKFKFPEPIPLNLRLKDMLEKEVDDKYYLSDKQIERLSTTTYQSNKYENRVTDMGGVIGTLCARDYKDPKCVQLDTENVVRKYGIFDDKKGKHQAGSVYDKECLCPTLDTAQGGWRQPLIEEIKNE